MDDHGHGTHVAGIAAGDGTASNGKFKGVAPDAKLLAYKVLDSYGYGYMSDVIAGIEAAVENKSDVISMSLGGFGDPDDIMCQAVDNAFDMGSVVVVAAGNSGPQRFTITSPGCARKALTVGATKLDDSIAFFSSIGPVPETGQVKPEVYAPGVNIMSAWARKGFMLPARDHEGKYYISLSGTSMATPHVAGVVALIKQQHPNWNAQQIRNTIISSGIPISARTVRSYAPTHLYMTPFMMNISQTYSFEYDTPEFQGNRVDALASVKSECIVYPSAVISLGINFLGDSSPEYRNRFWIENTGTTTQNMTALVVSSTNGVDIQITPTNFSIPQGETVSVDIIYTCDNTVLIDGPNATFLLDVIRVFNTEQSLNLSIGLLCNPVKFKNKHEVLLIDTDKPEDGYVDIIKIETSVESVAERGSMKIIGLLTDHNGTFFIDLNEGYVKHSSTPRIFNIYINFSGKNVGIARYDGVLKVHLFVCTCYDVLMASVVIKKFETRYFDHKMFGDVKLVGCIKEVVNRDKYITNLTFTLLTHVEGIWKIDYGLVFVRSEDSILLLGGPQVFPLYKGYTKVDLVVNGTIFSMCLGDDGRTILNFTLIVRARFSYGFFGSMWFYQNCIHYITKKYDATEFPRYAKIESVHEYVVDTTQPPDNLFEYLVIRIFVEVHHVQNPYLVVGGLFWDGKENGSIEIFTAVLVAESFLETNLSFGKNIIELRFYGVDIHSRGMSGRYFVVLTLAHLIEKDLWGVKGYPVAYTTFRTKHYLSNQFNPVSIEFLAQHSGYAVDDDNDSKYEELHLNITVNVHVEGNYSIYAILDVYLPDRAFEIYHLSPGRQTVRLVIPTCYLNMSSPSSESLGCFLYFGRCYLNIPYLFKPYDRDHFTIGYFDYSKFEAPQMEVHGKILTKPILSLADCSNPQDGFHDTLSFNVSMNINSEENDVYFCLEMILKAGSYSFITTKYFISDTEFQNVQLNFSTEQLFRFENNFTNLTVDFQLTARRCSMIEVLDELKGLTYDVDISKLSRFGNLTFYLKDLKTGCMMNPEQLEAEVWIYGEMYDYQSVNKTSIIVSNVRPGLKMFEVSIPCATDSAPKYYIEYGKTVAKSNQNVSVEVYMRRIEPYFGMINGTVESVRGVPVNGAKLMVSYSGNGTKISELTIDKNGTYQCSVPMGNLTVICSKEGFISCIEYITVFQGDIVTCNFTLRKCGWLTGKVIEKTGANPLSDAIIEVYYSNMTNAYVTKTTANGSYKLELEPNKYIVFCTLAGYVSEKAVVEIKPATTTIQNFELVKLGKLVICVKNEDLKLLRSHICVKYKTNFSVVISMFIDGWYNLTLPPDIYLVEVSAQGYINDAKIADMQEGKTVFLIFVLKPQVKVTLPLLIGVGAVCHIIVYISIIVLKTVRKRRMRKWKK